VPDGRHESFFERGYEAAIRDPVGGMGGWLISLGRDLKLLRHGPGFQQQVTYPLKKEHGAISGLGHSSAPASSMSITTASRFLADRIASALSRSAKARRSAPRGHAAPGDHGPPDRIA